MITHFETAAEAASALKYDIDDLIDNWIDEHGVGEEIQRRYLIPTMRKAGFAFFEEELLQHFESHPDYVVNPDGSVSYNDGFDDEDESWMPQD